MLVLGVVLIALMAGGCGSADSAPPPRVPPAAAVRASPGPHVAVIVMENHGYGDVLGNRDAPFENALARRYALATRAYAITHPSLPNYLALTSGSTAGMTSDCGDCHVARRNLVDQLEAAHRSWRAYMEGLPRPCWPGVSTDDYARKHDPFLYYDDVARNPARCRNVVPLSRLPGDLRAGRLPAFTWITPDLCHDTHDCDVRTGDRFLARLVPPLLAGLGRHGVLFLLWDEDDGGGGSCCRLAHGGHVPAIVAGGGAVPGGRLDTPVDHYSFLATIEDRLGLGRLAGAACPCTPSVAALLR